MKHTPTDFLSADAAAGKVLAHARLLQKLDRRLAATLPGGMRLAARVANYKAGTVVIHAENGAVATKLRQLGVRLAGEMAKAGVDCQAVEVRVQPRQNWREAEGGHQKPLSSRSAEVLQATADSMPDGPLRRALANLLARAARE